LWQVQDGIDILVGAGVLKETRNTRSYRWVAPGFDPQYFLKVALEKQINEWSAQEAWLDTSIERLKNYCEEKIQMFEQSGMSHITPHQLSPLVEHDSKFLAIASPRDTCATQLVGRKLGFYSLLLVHPINSQNDGTLPRALLLGLVAGGWQWVRSSCFVCATQRLEHSYEICTRHSCSQ
jgi:hypothetical protein